MPRLQVFSPVQSRDGSLSRDSYLKNAYVEPNGEGMRVVKRPGLAIWSTGSAGSAQGLTSYRDADDAEYLFAVNGSTLYNNSARTYSTLPDYRFDPTTSSSNVATLGVATSVARLGNTLFAVGYNSARTRFIVFYSSDYGASWSQLLDVSADGTTYPFGDSNWLLVSHSNKLVLVNHAFDDDVWESSDGTTWTRISTAHGMGSSVSPWRIASHAGALYVFRANTSNPLYKSTDNGVTWATAGASQAYNTSGTLRFSMGVYSDGTYLYVAGGSCAAAGQDKIYRSTDGTSFSELGTNALSEIGIGDTTGPGGGCVSTYALGMHWLLHWSDAGSGTRIGKLWSSADGQSWSLNTDFLQAGDIGASATLDPFSTSGGNANTPHCLLLAGQKLVFPWINGSAQHRIFTYNSSTGAAAVSAGTVGPGKLDFSQNYARTILGVKSRTKLYKLTVPGSLLTQVTDADYPTDTARGLVYLDGYFFVMDTDGTIWNSANEDITSWSALNFIAAEFEPDGGVALGKYGNYIVAWGNYTTEFFFNAGNASGSPLSPAQNGVMGVGCAHGDTVQTIDSQTLWVAQTKSGGQAPATGRFVAKLAGTTYEKLSTPDIDRILDADDFADVDACTFKVAGHSYYHVRLGTSHLSLVFDMSQSQWYVWTTRRTSFTNTITGVTTTNGTATGTATTSFSDGDQMVVSAFSGTHTALNGTYNVTVGTATTTLYWGPISSAYSGTSSGTGTMTGYSEDDFPVAYAADYAGNQILQDKSNGNLYSLNGTAYQDNSVYFDFQMRPPKMDFGSNEHKFGAWADFISDRQSGNALMRYSDDDGQNWTRYRPRSLSGARTRWHRLGAFRRRLFDLRVTANIPLRAEALDVEHTANG